MGVKDLNRETFRRLQATDRTYRLSGSSVSVTNAMFDGGYIGDKFAAEIKEIFGAEVEIANEEFGKVTVSNEAGV